MAARQPSPEKSRPQRRPSRDRDEPDRAPPLPKGSRREGIPDQGSPPHGEEPARPTDTGRHGA